MIWGCPGRFFRAKPPLGFAAALSASLLFFAVLTTGFATAQPPPFQQALPGYSYHFPRDFYAHNDFKLEWWYYTGNLEDESGRPFGYQLTFFRVALDGAGKIQNPSRWKIENVYFAHMALSDIEANEFLFFERINRAGLGSAGAAPDRPLVWNEDWTLTQQEKRHRLKAMESGTGLDLSLVPLKDLVIHGESGVSVKSEAEGNASHYFSYTRMQTEGSIFIKGREYRVRGTSWMDHEFSSNPLAEGQIGWDWFSLKLDNQTEIMLYRIRLKNGGTEPRSSGTLVSPGGAGRHLRLSDFTIAATGKWTSPRTGTSYPSGWEVSLPNDQIYLQITPDMPAQELYELRSISGSYWEGSVTVSGRYGELPVKGKGYVELVGYDQALQTKLPE